MQGRFLTGAWRHLAMMNWVVDPARLEPLVPRGTELDAFEGRTYVSLVGFLFEDTKLLGVGVPGHVRFEEVNLRFYVRRTDPGETEPKRAVVFVREIVPKAAIAWTARLIYNEQYVAHEMGHDIALPGDGPGHVQLTWQHEGRDLGMQVNVDGAAEPIVEGSEAEFITEHFWGYVTQRDGSTVEYQVEHPRWDAWSATSSRLIGDVPAYYGERFADVLRRPADSAFVAVGSDIVVRKPRRLPDTI